MSTRFLVLLAVVLLLLPSGVPSLWTSPVCDTDCCGCEAPPASELPSLSQGCCCEVRPASDLPFMPPAPERAESAGPVLPELTPMPIEAAPELPVLAAGPRLVPAAEPRPPPRPLFLLHAAFLC
ncbi:MAG: hypothetical protein ISR76_04985 [Planctomycetes bacterium]|nr:hypothetical protein [Planctomycetota bacterium]MBL7008331.1 hypothetical protein [Planctomycetota bacterium]